MKKFVLKLELIDDKDKRKALKTVSALSGIDQISIDMKGEKLTVLGTVDPVSVVSKLRKFWATDIISIGSAKEPEKNQEAKKEEGKGDAKGDEPMKEESKEDKKNEETKKAEQTESAIETILPYMTYYPPMNASCYVNHSVEENPNACVIC